MSLKWTDSQEIAIALSEKYPDVNPRHIRFTDLLSWIQGLEGFEDSAERCGERILEAIQMAWIEESGH